VYIDIGEYRQRCIYLSLFCRLLFTVSMVALIFICGVNVNISSGTNYVVEFFLYDV